MMIQDEKVRILIAQNRGIIATALVRRDEYENPATELFASEIEIQTLYAKVFVTGVGLNWESGDRRGRETYAMFEALTGSQRFMINIAMFLKIMGGMQRSDVPNLEQTVGNLFANTITEHGDLHLEIPAQYVMQQSSTPPRFHLSGVPRAAQGSSHQLPEA